MKMTPNQVVAQNLRRAREEKGWTQEEARHRLEPLIGELWSIATYSAAENTVKGERIRHFDADLVHAFSIMFGKPVQWFFRSLPEPERCPTCQQSVAPGNSRLYETPTRRCSCGNVMEWGSGRVFPIGGPRGLEGGPCECRSGRFALDDAPFARVIEDKSHYPKGWFDLKVHEADCECLTCSECPVAEAENRLKLNRTETSIA